jgi:hypothetical protein
MRKTSPSVRAALALCALSLLFAAGSPLAADWLVTRDGVEIETRGPWEEKGRLIVFTTADGTLSSMRASEFDLEASRALTEEKARAPKEEAPPPPARREPVLVLTDDDVRQVDPDSFFEDDGEGEEGEGGEDGSRNLEIVNWRQADLPDGGVRIRGTLRNNGDRTAVGLTVQVNLLDAQGELLATRPADLTSRGLAPSELANFQVDFPNVIVFSSASFEVEQVNVRVGPADDAQAPPESGQTLAETGEGEGL